MLAGSWQLLFRHLPPEQHSRFTLVTANGTEIAIQQILRIEADFSIIKGRLMGSQESGRVFIVPYASIDTFSFTNSVRDSEVAELFDSIQFDDSLPHLSIPDPIADGTGENGSGSQSAIRSEILERFRNARPGSNGPPRPDNA